MSYNCAICKHDKNDHGLSRGTNQQVCHSGQHGAVLNCDCPGYKPGAQEVEDQRISKIASNWLTRSFAMLEHLLEVEHANHGIKDTDGYDPDIKKCKTCDPGLVTLVAEGKDLTDRKALIWINSIDDI